MELEVIREIGDWLGGVSTPTYGVNALLAGVPRDAGDPVPPNVTVTDETRDAVTARGKGAQQITESGAQLQVLLFEDYEKEPELVTLGEEVQDSSELQVLIWYRRPDNATPAIAKRNASYTMRAVTRSLNRLMMNVSAAARERNQVQLVSLQGFRRVPVLVTNDPLATSAIVLTCQVRDESPLA
jgi:hypothetical protein